MTTLFSLATLACALGIALGDGFGVGVVAAQRIALFATLGGLWMRDRPRLRAAWALLAMLGCGALANANQRGDADSGPLAAPRDAVVEGTVCGRDLRASSWSVDLCDCTATEPGSDRLPRKIRLFAPAITASRPALEALRPGERIRVRLRLRPIRRASNPGARNTHERYLRLGIGARASLRDPRMLVRIGPRDATIPIGEAILDALARVRLELGARLSAAGSGGSLARALALGDRSGVPDAAREAFARLGIQHLLAVSGLHVGLVAGFAYAVGRRAVLMHARLAARHDPRRIALWGALAGAALYAVMSGWGLPVRRALLFLAVLCGSAASGRTVSGVQVLCLAALPLLLLEPSALFEMGARLSFVASAALLLARRETDSREARLPLLLRTSTTAIVATSPLVAMHGGHVGPYGFVANLVAVPWIGLIGLPASLAAAVAAAWPSCTVTDFVIACAAGVGRLTLDGALALAASLPRLPAAHHATPLAFVVLASGLAVVALCLRSTAHRLGVALVQSAILILAPAPKVDPEVPRVVMFDVGQGDATLVQGRNGAVLVDAGRAIEGEFDLGEHVVVPGLAALGVETLDLVIASHADIDHRGGLDHVLEHVEVGELWLPHGARERGEFAKLVATAASRGIVVHERGLGDAMQRFGDLRVEPVWPPRAGAPTDRNERSLVVRVGTGGASEWGDRILFTGDLGATGEAGLLMRGIDLRATILKVGHHGSAGSSTREFLEAVAADVALISAPCHGSSGLPTTEAISRLVDAELEIWWTGESGALSVGMSTQPRGRTVSGWNTKQRCWLH